MGNTERPKRRPVNYDASIDLEPIKVEQYQQEPALPIRRIPVSTASILRNNSLSDLNRNDTETKSFDIGKEPFNRPVSLKSNSSEVLDSPISVNNKPKIPFRNINLPRNNSRTELNRIETHKPMLQDIIETKELSKPAKLNFISTPKRLLPSDRHCMDPTTLSSDPQEFIMKRSNTLKDLRRHNRSHTSHTNIDSCSIESSKSKETAMKIKNAFIELDELKKRNEELERRLKESGQEFVGDGDKTKVWKEIEELTDMIIKKMNIEDIDGLGKENREEKVKGELNQKQKGMIEEQKLLVKRPKSSLKEDMKIETDNICEGALQGMTVELEVEVDTKAQADTLDSDALLQIMNSFGF